MLIIHQSGARRREAVHSSRAHAARVSKIPIVFHIFRRVVSGWWQSAIRTRVRLIFRIRAAFEFGQTNRTVIGFIDLDE